MVPRALCIGICCCGQCQGVPPCLYADNYYITFPVESALLTMIDISADVIGLGRRNADKPLQLIATFPVHYEHLYAEIGSLKERESPEKVITRGMPRWRH